MGAQSWEVKRTDVIRQYLVNAMLNPCIQEEQEQANILKSGLPPRPA
jgi:hypothetical protein